MTSQGANNIWPRQDIPERDKTKQWLSRHLDYSEYLITNYSNTKQRLTRLFNGYNGITNPQSMEWLTKTYGQENKAPYISYRVSKTKIDLLQGEWLKRPLISTVTTTNSDALSEKMERYYFMRGAMELRNEIGTVKDVAGVDVMEGIEIPENESVFQSMNFKDRCEDIMQIIMNKQTIHLDAKKKIAECFLDCEITNHCWFMVELNQKGEVKLHRIDPRDAIYESVEGDDYMEQSPIRGCRRSMPVHEILLRYELTKEQRDLLDSARINPNDYIGPNGRSRGYMNNNGVRNELLCDVIHIEWDSVTPLYKKVYKKFYKVVSPTHPQAKDSMDENGNIKPILIKNYFANKDYHRRNVEKGFYTIEERPALDELGMEIPSEDISEDEYFSLLKQEGDFDVVTKYITQVYEATRIGGLIDINMRPVQGVKRNVDKPSEILSTTYIGYIHGRVNGVTVSLQQMIENLSNIYDLIQYKKNMEIAKMKGKYLTIDKAGLGPKQKMGEVYYRLMNDQVVEYDSSAAGNLGGRQLDPSIMFKTGDLGLSESFKDLLIAEQNVINDINQLTGINENRQGITAASSTATAQQSDINNSRTITEALFYGFSGFTKRVMKAICDKSAISYAYYKTEEGESILGAERFAFLKATVELAYRNYGLEIEDGSKYMEISEKINALMEVSLNAKEIRTMDAMNVLLAETLAQKKAYLEKAWKDMQQRIMEDQQAAQQSQEAMAARQFQTELQIATDDREDRQNSEKENIVLKGQVQQEVDRAKAENDMALQNQKIQGDIIIKTDTPK